MYNDNTFDGLFTGTSDGNGGWNYPTAPQNIVIKFPTFYLSAEDLVSGGAVISSETGESEDFTIGNAPAKVFTATFNDPDDLMDALTWGDGTVYIGVVTSSVTSNIPNSNLVYVKDGANTLYARLVSGNYRFYLEQGSAYYTNLGSKVPVCVVLDNTNGYGYCYCDNGDYYQVNLSTRAFVGHTGSGFMDAKYKSYYEKGIALDANGMPKIVATLGEAGASSRPVTHDTYGYVPMGTFDFSNIDTAGIAFAVEAYDKMTLFDADATDWVASLSFGVPQTINDLVTALMTEMGMTATISASAVNRTVSWSANPITSYAVTYRDVLKWLAEIMGCNARMGRTGNVEFYTIDPTAVETIEPGVIVGSTRTKTRYSIPVIDKVVCYNTLGAGYEVHTGSGDVPYYIVGNPFLDPSADTQPLTDLLGVLDDVPAYFPTTLGQVCADPRLDSGDVVNARPIGGADDGTDDYPVLVTRQVLTWNNSCLAELTSTGNQVRAIPESMNNTDLASMVDSNPTAVIAKIEAVGISADWITSGKLTVKDSLNRTLFDADKDFKKVQIAGFDVDYTGIEQTNGTVTATLDSSGYLDFDDADVGQPSHSRLEASGLTVEDTLLGDNTFIQPGAIYVTDTASNSVKLISSEATASDGTNKTSLVAKGITFDDGTSTPRLSVIKRLHDSSNMTDNITLQRGMYLAIVTHTNNTTAGQQGLYVIQAYDTNSVILTIAAAANSTLTISGLTLTWTTTNTYRALRLIYLS